jgi:hypothetical protein
MNKISAEDFGMYIANGNGQFVRIVEINDMIQYGAIKIDRKRLEEYKLEKRQVSK